MQEVHNYGSFRKIVDGMRDTLGDNMLRKVHALLK